MAYVQKRVRESLRPPNFFLMFADAKKILLIKIYIFLENFNLYIHFNKIFLIYFLTNTIVEKVEKELCSEHIL